MLPYRVTVRLFVVVLFLALTATAAAARQRTDFGTLSIQVRPPEAEIFIDGERWTGPEGAGPLQIQLSPGPHRVEMRAPGRQTFFGNVMIRAGETSTLNVLLTPGETAVAPPGPPQAPAPPQAPPYPPRQPSGNIRMAPAGQDGFVFAPDYRIAEVNHQTGHFIGAYGGYVFAGQFMIGAGGYWQANSNNGLHLTYGGPVLEWRFFPGKTVGFNVHGLVGGGWTYFDHNHYYYYYPDGHPQPVGGMYGGVYYYGPYYSNGFFVAEPEAQVVVRFGDFARLQGGIGYRAVSEHGLSGASGSISVQFGR